MAEKPDAGPWVVLAVVAAVAAIVIAIFFAAFMLPARADAATFDQRFAATADNPVTPPQRWQIDLLLGVNSKIVDSTRYGDQIFTSSDDCESAALADAKLQDIAKRASVAATKQYGRTAVIAIACALDVQ